MIQAFGLTSNPRKELPPAVHDVSFEAGAGLVTALLGTPGAGKTTALRLMLELQPGRGVTHFRGRPLHRIAHPSREVGVLLGDVPGHPARTVRGHLRMLCAAAGVPARRADEVLEAVDLVSLRHERLGALSRGMDRRLGLACALLADPHTLVLDDPADGLSAREARWLHGVLRAHAAQGGTVLFTTADTKEAARNADRVVTLEKGRLVADQEADDFARNRLRPRVAVRSPHAARLAAVLSRESRAAQRSVEIVREGGNLLAVYGSSCADIGETAFRHGILVHRLADEVGDMGPGAGTTPLKVPAPGGESGAGEPREAGPSSGTGESQTPGSPHMTGAVPRPDAAAGHPAPARTPEEPQEPQGPQGPGEPEDPREADASQEAQEAQGAQGAQGAQEAQELEASGELDVPQETGESEAVRPLCPDPAAPWPDLAAALAPASGPRAPEGPGSGVLSPLPPPISVRSARSPLRPLRYEIRRATGIGTGLLTGAAVLLGSVLVAVLLARAGHTSQPRLLAAWPEELPLPPAALGAGLLGALSFGDEFRHPALAADRGTVPRRLGLLTAKLLVAAATALTLALLTAGCDTAALYLLYGREVAQVPADGLSPVASWAGLVVGCAWAGVLGAGVFRSTAAGLAAVVAVPVVVVPLVQRAFQGPAVRTAAGFPARVREVFLSQWPFGGERYLEAAARVIAQPVGGALTLSLTALLCAYLLTTLRGRAR
ncbi:ATP-binding cassette domain-containing protein [Streptomyces sp. NPDC020996]|uniref:ABC transporter ATP-binding protein n=1 Tax=Streptomyces sp. NPDC020996 TaxID=3154791 RepID=UPI0033D12062